MGDRRKEEKGFLIVADISVRQLQISWAE
jgi:hypothetical protein